MNKPLVKYIMSFTKDGTTWLESQYANDTEVEYKDIVKKAEKKFNDDGVLGVKIIKKTIEEVFRLDREEVDAIKSK
jgi:hypothetical protein